MSDEPNKPLNKRERLLRDAGVTERRPGGGRGLFSEPVLLVKQERPSRNEWIYNQEFKVLATFRRKPAPADLSLLRRLLFRPRVWELVDVRDQVVLLTVRGNLYSFNTIDVDGNDLGRVKVRTWNVNHLFEGRHLIKVGGEVIGSFRRLFGGRRYRVVGADKVELGRISHHRHSVGPDDLWNVVEIDDAMPDQLRRLMPAVSKAVFSLYPEPAR
jgi:hypothetical protein